MAVIIFPASFPDVLVDVVSSFGNISKSGGFFLSSNVVTRVYEKRYALLRVFSARQIPRLAGFRLSTARQQRVRLPGEEEFRRNYAIAERQRLRDQTIKYGYLQRRLMHTCMKWLSAGRVIISIMISIINAAGG